MFTWICPKCGREVPPAYSECPDCHPESVPAAAAPPPPTRQAYAPPPPTQPAGRRPIWQSGGAAPTPPPPAQAYAAPPPPPLEAYAPPPPPPPPAYTPTQFDMPRAYTPPAPAPAQPPPPPPRGPALPTWLLAILFTLAFGGVVAGAYWVFGSKSPAGTSAAADTSIQLPVTAPGAKANPYQKFIEISGMRFAEDPKNKEKTLCKFVITNHADDDIPHLAGTVAILSRSDKSGQPVAGFTFSTSLASQEAKDLTTTLDTKLKPYELPDWQFAQPVLQITVPAAASSDSQ